MVLNIRTVPFRFWIVCSWLTFSCTGLTGILYAQMITPPYRYGSLLYELSFGDTRHDLQQEAQHRLLTAQLRFALAPAADRVAIALAETHFAAREYDAGYRVLDSLYAIRPYSNFAPQIVQLYAERLFEQNNLQKATEYYNRAFNLANERFVESGDSLYWEIAADVTFWSAVALWHNQKNEEAEKKLNICAHKFVGTLYADDALYFLGRFAGQRGEYDQAITLYGELFKHYPRRNTALASYLQLAHTNLMLRRPPEALRALQSAQDHAERAASPADITQSICERSPQQCRFDAYLDHALEQIYYLRGEVLNQQANYSSARSTFSSLVARYPASPILQRARLGLGYTLWQMDSLNAALDQYNAVIDADNMTSLEDKRLVASARFLRALILKKKGDRQTARTELHALSIRSDFPFTARALLEAGQMYYEDGKMDEARKTLERAAREATDPLTQMRTQLILGEVCLDAGYFTMAVKAFEQTLSRIEALPSRLLPNKGVFIHEARLKHGIALVGAKQHQQAIIALTKFITQYHDNDGLEEAKFWLAEAYYHADLLTNAGKSYQDFLKHYPEGKRCEEALYGLGWTQFRQRMFTESSGTFTRLLREFPASSYALDALTRKGDGHYLSKQYRPAADAYRQATRLQPKSQQGEYAAFQLAQCLYRLQEYEQAIREAESFLRRYPSSLLADDASYLIAWIYFQQKQYQETVTQCKILVEQYPEGNITPRAYYAMGDALYNLGKYDEAIHSYKLVAERSPGSPFASDAIHAVQYCLTLLGREQEAAEFADKYISNNPNSRIAHDVKFKKAELLFTSQKYTSALSEYEDFLKKHPESPRSAEALLMIAKSYTGMQDTLKAEQTLRLVQQRYPRSENAAQALLEHALLKLDQKNTKQADSLFIQLQTQYARFEAARRAAFERANLREMSGDTLQAVVLYQEVAERYPGTDYGDRCRYRVASWFRGRGQHDSALVHYEKLTRRTDDLGAECQFRVGEMFMRKQHYALAIEAFIKSKTVFHDVEDWYSLALLNLGVCYEQQKNWESAREMYRLVLIVRKEDDYGKTAQAALDRLAKM